MRWRDANLRPLFRAEERASSAIIGLGVATIDAMLIRATHVAAGDGGTSLQMSSHLPFRLSWPRHRRYAGDISMNTSMRLYLMRKRPGDIASERSLAFTSQRRRKPQHTEISPEIDDISRRRGLS